MNQTYSFVYDSFGNVTSMKVGSRTLASYQYGPNNGLLLSQTYGNGDIVAFTYDTLGRVKTTTYDDGRVLLYTYNGEGRLYSVTETLGEDVVTYIYNYDTIGRLISSEKKAGTTSLLHTHQSYDAYNRLVGQSWKLGNSTYSESYTYNDVDNSISTFTAGNGETIELTYDLLRRLSLVDTGQYEKYYTYREITEVDQTTQITGLEYLGLPEDLEFGYTYNNLGYIATYAAPGEQTITYTYDNLGQLLQAVGDVTYTYTYDSAGNILTANGHTYTYGDADWKDLLTAYDNQAITYDAIGNPLSYYNGTRWTFTWENGRSLATATNGTVSLSYEYDLDGLRTTKTVGNAVHDYYYAGGRLLREVITTTADDETVTTATLDFFYDASGQPYVLKYNGVEYYYITNLQGDVVSLVNPTTGVPVATYEYDPFGKVISATGDLAVINPLRYRGYYYDSETSFYYLQSRYYDPTICRFINADSYVSTGKGVLGNHMFAYCNNNPICHADPAGDVLIEVTLSTVGAIVGITVCGVLIVHYGAMLLAEFFEWLSSQWYAPFATVTYIEEEEQLPDVTYPGDDPEKAPEGYEWRGKGEQGSKKGSYFNKDTKESLHPDLDHPDGVDPHWDYNYRGSGCKGWRIFANGVIEKKLMMTLIITAVEWWDEYGR